MKWFFRRFLFLFLTLLSINFFLYILFWLASSQLTFGFFERLEEPSFEVIKRKKNLSSSNNFWQSYGEWLGILPQKSSPYLFSKLSVPIRETLYSPKSLLPISQRWLILKQEEKGKVELYGSTPFFLEGRSSTLPPANKISQWQHIKNVQILFTKEGWFVSQKIYSGILQGNWGVSLSFSRPISTLIISRIPLTFLLGFLSVLIAYGLALPLSYFMAQYKNPLSQVIKLLGIFFFSSPRLIFGIFILWLFSWQLKWIPLQALPLWEFSSSPLKGLISLLGPALVLSLPALLTNSLLITRRIEEEQKKDYILFARAKGIRESKIVLTHLLKPILSPLIIRLKHALLLLFSGSLIVENLFGIVGIGSLSLEAILNNDIPLALALSNLIAFIRIIGQFLSEGILALWYEKNLS